VRCNLLCRIVHFFFLSLRIQSDVVERSERIETSLKSIIEPRTRDEYYVGPKRNGDYGVTHVKNSSTPPVTLPPSPPTAAYAVVTAPHTCHHRTMRRMKPDRATIMSAAGRFEWFWVVSGRFGSFLVGRRRGLVGSERRSRSDGKRNRCDGARPTCG